MRIIAGLLKGRRLHSPGPRETLVRPTADRAREALFSILQAWPQGPFLDLFAGTGAMGLEAWSRGYHPVTLVERAPEALACLRSNARDTDVRILARDARAALKTCGPGFAVVFADPPYAEAAALFALLGHDVASLLEPEGVLVWETDRHLDLPAPPSLELLQVRTYGTTRFHFFRSRRE